MYRSAQSITREIKSFLDLADISYVRVNTSSKMGGRTIIHGRYAAKIAECVSERMDLPDGTKVVPFPVQGFVLIYWPTA